MHVLGVLALAVSAFGGAVWLGGPASPPPVARRGLVPAVIEDACAGQAWERAEPLPVEHDVAHAISATGQDELADLARQAPSPSAVARARSPERLDFRSPPPPALVATRDGAAPQTTILAGPAAQRSAAAFRASTPESAAHGAAHPVRGPPAHVLS
ncbi:Hypothetical protein A7982_11756 [Minicystis rosea]|nr:Hypothetical protein A7982_11756 [Minicystis rosea]